MIAQNNEDSVVNTAVSDVTVSSLLFGFGLRKIRTNRKGHRSGNCDQAKALQTLINQINVPYIFSNGWSYLWLRPVSHTTDPHQWRTVTYDGTPSLDRADGLHFVHVMCHSNRTNYRHASPGGGQSCQLNNTKTYLSETIISG
ncbi:hypothetical protein J6590_015086 [Homalodisca vitripennis]|nr:hypothetical protein J6590_015086 [Homalodisca vitripennis]